MPERTAYAHGTPSWVDLETPDPAGAGAFYGGLFGWEAEEGPADTGTYTTFFKNGKRVAGAYETPAEHKELGLPPMWNTYITVDDAAAAIASARVAGGRILRDPYDVMDAGRMAILMDPTGAAFALWEAKAHAGAELVNEPGTFTWAELVTGDTDAARRFYTAVLGVGATVTNETPAGPYTVFTVGDDMVAGMIAKMPGMEAMPSHWTVYFGVENVDAAAARIGEMGGSVIVPGFDVPGVGRLAVVRDSTGAAFTIMEFPQAD